MRRLPTIVYGFAAFYLLALTFGWAVPGGPEVSNGDFFAQSALVLAAIGLYQATPPQRDR